MRANVCVFVPVCTRVCVHVCACALVNVCMSLSERDTERDAESRQLFTLGQNRQSLSLFSVKRLIIGFKWMFQSL